MKNFPNVLSEIEGVDRDDGGIEGCWSHFPPPQETHQKHIYTWNNSHWKQLWDWQKASCTTKIVRKLHTELGRKGREAVRSGPVAQAGVSEEKGDYRDRDSPWGVNGSSYILQARVLRSGPVKTSSLWGLGGLTWGLWEAQTPSTWEECMYALTFSWSRVERADWNCTGGWLVFHDRPRAHQLELSECSSPA